MNKKGSVHIVAIIGMVSIVIGGLIWVFIQNQLSQPIEVDESSVVVNSDNKTAKSALSSLYDRYLNELPSSDSRELIQQYANEGLIVSGFRIRNDIDSLLCTDGKIPKSVNISVVNQSDSSANLRVNKVYMSATTANSYFTAMMKRSSKGVWVLENVNCD